MSMLQKLSQGSRRRNRSPEHDFHLRHRAFVIQPFMYHPVRPGETLKSVLWQSRAVSDPVANPLMGWHLEYYLFYVQLQDAVPVGQEDNWLKPLWDPTGNFVASGWGAVTTRLENGDVVDPATPDFKYKMYQRIIEEYFREEGEVWNSSWKMSGALALARRNRKDVYESFGSEYGAPVDVTINIADGLTLQEIVDAMTQYAMLMDTSMGAVTTFEDYLASQGQGSFSDVKRAYRPELLRVMKEWTYPTNTVEPTTGVPSSALSWSISARADKDRYFKEPGYIVGLTVARPKTLRPGNDDLNNYPFKTWEDWLPQQAMHNPQAGLPSRDLFEYGYQFVNWDVNGTYKANQIQWSPVGSNTPGLTGPYPVEASINANIWKAPASNNVRQDGKVQLNILTDLPPDMNVGDMANQEPASEARSIHELASEYVAKLKERREGKRVNLPNIPATLEKLLPTLGPTS